MQWFYTVAQGGLSEDEMQYKRVGLQAFCVSRHESSAKRLGVIPPTSLPGLIWKRIRLSEMCHLAEDLSNPIQFPVQFPPQLISNHKTSS